jgi:hypothetical protein
MILGIFEMKNITLLTIIGINFMLLTNMNYIFGQDDNSETMNDTTKVSEVLTPDSINETRFNSNNERNASFNDTTKVSEVLTPDSINETRFRD